MRHEMKLLPKIIIFLLPTKLRAWLSSNIFPEESNFFTLNLKLCTGIYFLKVYNFKRENQTIKLLKTN